MAASAKGHVQGHGKTFADAVQDAWTKAPKHGDKTTYEIASITVHGNNPLSGYVVVLAPTG